MSKYKQEWSGPGRSLPDGMEESPNRNYPETSERVGDPLMDPAPYGPKLAAFVVSPDCEQCADGGLDAEKLRMAKAGERTLYLCEGHMSAREEAA